jgi:hypothetical protein
VCTLPLTTAHHKVGTLTFGNKAPDIYTTEEVHFLSVVVEQIALAFDNALNFEASQASQEQLLKKNDEDVSGTVFRTGKLWCGSVQEAKRLGTKYTLQAEVGTLCILPLVSRGRVLGIFGVVKYQDAAFTSDDVEFLFQIANQVAIAVQNALALMHFHGARLTARLDGMGWLVVTRRTGPVLVGSGPNASGCGVVAEGGQRRDLHALSCGSRHRGRTCLRPLVRANPLERNLRPLRHARSHRPVATERDEPRRRHSRVARAWRPSRMDALCCTVRIAPPD